jgi:hypothetical protein
MKPHIGKGAGLFVLLIATSVMATSYAAMGYGTSSIMLASTHGSLSATESAQVAYTV